MAGERHGTISILALLLAALLLCGCPEKDDPPPPPPPDAPLADFTTDVTTGAAHLDVQYTDASTPVGEIDTWSWDFGDTATSLVQHPSHTYTAAGTYTVTLTVTSPGGTHAETKTDLIVVTAAVLTPNFSAASTTVAAGTPLAFTDLSTCTEPLTTWSWDFGDSTLSSSQNPSHTYATTGTYTVSLTVDSATQNGVETKTDYIVAVQPSKPTGGSGGATGDVTSSYNGRSYRLYVPATYSDATPAPLVAAFHGFGDTYTNFFAVMKLTAWKTAADNQGFLILVPDHNNSSRPSFLHLSGGSTLDLPNTTAEMTDVLDTIYYGVGASYNVETAALYWIGFSEGGTFSDLAATIYTDELRAVAPYAGYVGGKTFPVSRDIPVYSLCGTTDPFYTNAPAAHQEWVDAGHPTNNAWVAGVGHAFMTLCSSGPAPESVYTWMRDADCMPVISGLP